MNSCSSKHHLIFSGTYQKHDFQSVNTIIKRFVRETVAEALRPVSLIWARGTMDAASPRGSLVMNSAYNAHALQSGTFFPDYFRIEYGYMQKKMA